MSRQRQHGRCSTKLSFIVCHSNLHQHEHFHLLIYQTLTNKMIKVSSRSKAKEKFIPIANKAHLVARDLAVAICFANCTTNQAVDSAPLKLWLQKCKTLKYICHYMKSKKNTQFPIGQICVSNDDKELFLASPCHEKD